MRDILLLILIWLLGLFLHLKIRPRLFHPKRPKTRRQTPPISRPHPSRPKAQSQSPKAPQRPHPIHGVQEVVSSNLAGPTNTQWQSPPHQPPPPPV